MRARRGRRAAADRREPCVAGVGEPRRPERFRFERAGFTVDGWVMKPVGFTEGRRYPALLNIHGGPHAQYGLGFFDEFQVQAAAGFGVIFLNPRGSQGYGEDFTRAVVGDWGGGDYADVMAGLDEALRRARWIDPGGWACWAAATAAFLPRGRWATPAVSRPPARSAR